jgi:hypothetical protein
LNAGGNITIGGGTLDIVKLGSGSFSAGQEYKIFNTTGVISGAFTEILPALANNLKWDTSRLSEGIIAITNATGIDDISGKKLVKSVEYYDITGRLIDRSDAGENHLLHRKNAGVLIRKITFVDGSMEVKKIFSH